MRRLCAPPFAVRTNCAANRLLCRGTVAGMELAMSTGMATLPAPSLMTVLVLILSCADCRQEQVTLASLPKAQGAPAAPPAVAQASVAPPSAAPASAAAPAFATAEEGGPALKWSLPGGWVETHPGGMRYATLRPPGGSVDVSVVVLSGPAGGELANVNRWRSQIGLSAIGEPALSAARVTLHAKAGDLAVYDFLSDGEKQSRMVAALATNGDRTWFLKMLGDAVEVKKARPEFNHLLQSLHFDAAN